jgi:hypothetical protein
MRVRHATAYASAPSPRVASLWPLLWRHAARSALEGEGLYVVTAPLVPLLLMWRQVRRAWDHPENRRTLPERCSRSSPSVLRGEPGVARLLVGTGPFLRAGVLNRVHTAPQRCRRRREATQRGAAIARKPGETARLWVGGGDRGDSGGAPGPRPPGAHRPGNRATVPRLRAVGMAAARWRSWPSPRISVSRPAGPKRCSQPTTPMPPWRSGTHGSAGRRGGGLGPLFRVRPLLRAKPESQCATFPARTCL